MRPSELVRLDAIPDIFTRLVESTNFVFLSRFLSKIGWDGALEFIKSDRKAGFWIFTVTISQPNLKLKLMVAIWRASKRKSCVVSMYRKYKTMFQNLSLFRNFRCNNVLYVRGVEEDDDAQPMGDWFKDQLITVWDVEDEDRHTSNDGKISVLFMKELMRKNTVTRVHVTFTWKMLYKTRKRCHSDKLSISLISGNR